MRRWLGPIAVALLLALGAYYVTLWRTPDLLMSAAISRVGTGGFNRFIHAPMATAASRVIVRPSPDLAYSSCPYDLVKGPVLIDAVPVAAPYWSLSIFDSRTDAVFVRNGGQAQGKPFRVAIALPGQAVPSGYQAVRVGGNRGIALIRILVAQPGDFAAIDRARRATVCRAG